MWDWCAVFVVQLLPPPNSRTAGCAISWRSCCHTQLPRPPVGVHENGGRVCSFRYGGEHQIGADDAIPFFLPVTPLSHRFICGGEGSANLVFGWAWSTQKGEVLCIGLRRTEYLNLPITDSGAPNSCAGGLLKVEPGCLCGHGPLRADRQKVCAVLQIRCKTSESAGHLLRHSIFLQSQTGWPMYPHCDSGYFGVAGQIPLVCRFPEEKHLILYNSFLCRLPNWGT